MKTDTASASAAYGFNVNWVDFVIVALLLVGVWRGRKRGMSEELLDIIKWAIVVVAAGFLYEPAGRFLASTSVFSPLSCYIAVYCAIALFIVVIFSFIRKSVGAKLVGSDVFGSGEYYLGMMAGAFRYSCIILVGLAFLNARYYSPDDLRVKAKYQMDNFGSSFFLTLPDLQQEVFKHSMVGRLTKEYLGIVLIRPTPPEDKSLGNSDNVGRARERSVYDMLDKK
jgi:uncharacterized membrane protein required for colicin V production